MQEFVLYKGKWVVERRKDPTVLAAVLIISCLALSSYHRATVSFASTSLSPISNSGRASHVHAGAVGGRQQRDLAVAEGQRRDLRAAPKLLLRYTACTGLINQQYSHIAAFSLAALLRADIVLPPGACRDSFKHHFSTKQEENEMSWHPIPTEMLLDVERITAAWSRLGITVHPAPQLNPFPDLTQPKTAYPLYGSPPGSGPALVARLEDLYLKPRDLPELAAMARQAVANATSAALEGQKQQQQQQEQQPGGVYGAEGGGGGGSSSSSSAAIVAEQLQAQYIVLDLPCTLFSLRTASALPLVSQVAQSLAFNPHLVRVADRVVEQLTLGGRRPYNGVHLRVEKDAKDWAEIMGGPLQIWHLYLLLMEATPGFDASMPLFVATGLLSYGAGQDWEFTVTTLKGRGVAGSVHCKEEYVPDFELKELNSEQLALLDFLILSRSQQFVGFGSSTFSFFLREYRALHGVPRSSSHLVNSSRIGTDKLFAAAATVALDVQEQQQQRWGAGAGGLFGWLRQLAGAVVEQRWQAGQGAQVQ